MPLASPQDPRQNLEYADDMEMDDHPRAHRRMSRDAGNIGGKLSTILDVHSETSLENQDEALQATKSTHADAQGMKRMGKQQQLVRHFRLVSTVSFVALATAAWEIGLFVISPGLTDGGRAGLVWNVLWNIVGFGPIYLSMAEVSTDELMSEISRHR